MTADKFRVANQDCVRAAIDDGDLDKLKLIAERWLLHLGERQTAFERVSNAGQKWTQEEIAIVEREFEGARKSLSYHDWTARRDAAALKIHRTREAVTGMVKRLGYRIVW